jgi:hypothetical protein
MNQFSPGVFIELIHELGLNDLAKSRRFGR